MEKLIRAGVLREKLWDRYEDIRANADLYDNAEETADEICGVISILDEMPAVDEENKPGREDNWIPVEEGLPELLPNDNCTADVLVSILDESDPEAGTSTCAGFMEDGEWYTYSNHDYEKVGSTKGFKDKVVAWCEMPADYVMKERK